MNVVPAQSVAGDTRDSEARSVALVSGGKGRNSWQTAAGVTDGLQNLSWRREGAVSGVGFQVEGE